LFNGNREHFSRRKSVNGYFNVPLVLAFRTIALYISISSDMSIVPRRFSDLSLSLSNRRHTVPSKTGILLIGIAIVLNIQELTPAKITLFFQPVKCSPVYSPIIQSCRYDTLPNDDL
jgi:hypothetical protein